MATVVLSGDTVRYPALRHEVPLEVIDPFLLVARDGDALVEVHEPPGLGLAADDTLVAGDAIATEPGIESLD